MTKENYNLKYSNTERMLLYFVKNREEVIKFNPIYCYSGRELRVDTINSLLQKLDIVEVPYIKLFPFKNPGDDYNDSKFPRGTSGYLRTIKKPVIAINPTSSYKQFVLFHEITHIMLHHSTCNISYDTKEIEANAVASLVLNEFNVKDDMLSMIKYFDLHLIDISLESCNRVIVTSNKILEILKDSILHDFN